MSGAYRAQRPGHGSSMTPVYLFLAGYGVASVPIAAFALAGGDLSGNAWLVPAFYFLLAAGKLQWTSTAWVMLVLLIAGIGGFAAALGWLWRGRSTGARREEKSLRRLDHLTATMTDPAAVPETSPKWLARESERLAPLIEQSHPGRLGVPQGITVRGNRVLRATWEYVVIAFAGTRMGKTAALAIPAVCSAPGAMIATSNKKDLFTHTAGVRREHGDVWLFDLQGVVTGNKTEAARFWFNPLEPVIDLPSANKVSSYFISAALDARARTDGYFDGTARDLLGSYILAAALAGGDLRHVVEWLIDAASDVPVKILQTHGYTGLAETMRGKQAVNARQRDGFYDMARRFLAPLDEPRYAAAVLPPRRVRISFDEHDTMARTSGDYVHSLPQLRPEEFVKSRDSLYALSMEGPGSASAIAMALIGSVLDAAEQFGATQIDGRMPVPLVAVLDEAANVCKLEGLPSRYSHYGSRGMYVLTILQSPSQGRKVWGAEEFKEMRDAASMTWYGGNVDDDAFIADLSKQIGDHYSRHQSYSNSTGVFSNSNHASRQISWNKEPIMDPSDLTAMPKTRAVVTLPGSKPLLVRKMFWSGTEWKDQIVESLALYGDGYGPLGPGSGRHAASMVATSAPVKQLPSQFFRETREL